MGDSLTGPLVLLIGVILITLTLWIFPAILAGLGKMLGSKNASWGRAFGAIILCAVVGLILAIPLSLILPGIGTVGSLFISWLIDSAIIGGMFDIGFGKGLVVAFLFDLACLAILVLLVVALGGVLGIGLFGTGASIPRLW